MYGSNVCEREFGSQSDLHFAKLTYLKDNIKGKIKHHLVKKGWLTKTCFSKDNSVRILMNKKVTVSRVESGAQTLLTAFVSQLLWPLMNCIAAHSELYCCKPVLFCTLVTEPSGWRVPETLGVLSYPFGTQIPCDNPTYHPLVLHITPALASEGQCSLCSWICCLPRSGWR